MDARIDKEIPAIRQKMLSDMNIKVDRDELQEAIKNKIDLDVVDKINERLKKMEDLIQSLTKQDDDSEASKNEDNQFQRTD